MDCGTGLCRADTSARRKAEDAGATPEAAAQIKREAGLDGFRAKPERENDGKNGEYHKKNCDRARMAAPANPCICSSRAKVKARHYPSRCRRLNTGFLSPFFDHREKSGSRCRDTTDAGIRPQTGGMGPGEAEPAATASRRLHPGMAAPANSCLCRSRATVKARHRPHTVRH